MAQKMMEKDVQKGGGWRAMHNEKVEKDPQKRRWKKKKPKE